MVHPGRLEGIPLLNLSLFLFLFFPFFPGLLFFGFLGVFFERDEQRMLQSPG